MNSQLELPKEYTVRSHSYQSPVPSSTLPVFQQQSHDHQLLLRAEPIPMQSFGDTMTSQSRLGIDNCHVPTVHEDRLPRASTLIRRAPTLPTFPANLAIPFSGRMSCHNSSLAVLAVKMNVHSIPTASISHTMAVTVRGTTHDFSHSESPL